jgi:hypothetical protein
MDEQKLTIRVTGLGHKVTLKDLPAASTTVEVLREKVSEATGLPPRFQKLIGPQKLNINSYPENDEKNHDPSLGTRTLSELGIRDRTKLMLLHSPVYQIEKDTYEQLEAARDEILRLETSIKDQTKESRKSGYVSEMITRICCRLDAIDVAGSSHLRAQRKELIQKADALEGLSVAEC